MYTKNINIVYTAQYDFLHLFSQYIDKENVWSRA